MIVTGPAPTMAIGSRYGNTVSSGFGRVFGRVITGPFRLGREFLVNITRTKEFEVQR